MLLQIPDVLTTEQVAHARHLLDSSNWIDGRVTAGTQSAQVKRNLQLPQDHPAAHELGDMFSNLRENTHVPDKEFFFTPPKGVDVIR